MKNDSMKAFEYWKEEIYFVTIETLDELIKAMDDDLRLTNRQYYILRHIAIKTAYEW